MRGRAGYRLLRGVAAPVPIRTSNSSLSCTPFFIITSGRSGSTLLRSILMQHPTINIPPECKILGQVIYNFKQEYRFLSWPNVVRLVMSEIQNLPEFAYWELDLTDFYPIALEVAKPERSLAKLIDSLYQYYAQVKKPGATYWGEKSPQNVYCLYALEQVFPGAKYIHLIRDGRDVVASIVKAEFNSDIDMIGHHWLKSIKNARNFGARIRRDRYHEMFYEELVQEPEPVIQQVCRFLGLDYLPEMLQFWQNVESLGDTKLKHHQNLKKPINPNSIGKWRSQLSREEKAILQKRLGPKLQELNYPLD